jgi:hypothetical protein
LAWSDVYTHGSHSWKIIKKRAPKLSRFCGTSGFFFGFSDFRLPTQIQALPNYHTIVVVFCRWHFVGDRHGLVDFSLHLIFTYPSLPKLQTV